MSKLNLFAVFLASPFLIGAAYSENRVLQGAFDAGRSWEAGECKVRTDNLKVQADNAARILSERNEKSFLEGKTSCETHI